MRALSARNDEPSRFGHLIKTETVGHRRGAGFDSEELNGKEAGATIYAEMAGYGTSGDAFILLSHLRRRRRYWVMLNAVTMPGFARAGRLH
jgi:3-oxoacyl-(acyl-carrier-protein) synthase